MVQEWGRGGAKEVRHAERKRHVPIGTGSYASSTPQGLHCTGLQKGKDAGCAVGRVHEPAAPLSREQSREINDATPCRSPTKSCFGMSPYSTGECGYNHNTWCREVHTAEKSTRKAAYQQAAK